MIDFRTSAPEISTPINLPQENEVDQTAMIERYFSGFFIFNRLKTNLQRFVLCFSQYQIFNLIPVKINQVISSSSSFDQSNRIQL